jgi:hypothetical protein
MTFPFMLDPVTLGTDADGDPITTLVVREENDRPTEAVSPGSANTSHIDTLGLRALDEAMKSDAIEPTVFDDHTSGLVVRGDHWRAAFYQLKIGEQEAKKRAFLRIGGSLLTKGLIGSRDGFVWPIGWSR